MWRIAGSTGALGLEIAAYIGLCYLGGQWLDGRFGTGPWLEWIGLVVGVGAAINALIRVNRAYKKSLRQEDATPPDKPRS
jgi:F0F1-type ATP synthase assembly protein I